MPFLQRTIVGRESPIVKNIRFFIETKIYVGQEIFHLTTALFCSGFRAGLTHFSTGISGSAQENTIPLLNFVKKRYEEINTGNHSMY
jgi:hypothetical protein